MIQELNERSREIFRRLVETYMETGEPVGSRTISRRLNGRLSPASVRNVMADLEEAGLLFAPHTSAGRLPTEAGMRIFVDGLLELGNLTADERASIEGRCNAAGRSLQDVLTDASTMLAGLSRCAGLVLAPKGDNRLKHVEFVGLGPDKALVVTVNEAGLVENRVIELPPGMTVEAMTEASNYLNSRLRGRTIAEAREEVLREVSERRAELDQLTSRLVEAGLATWGGGGGPPTLIVSGRSVLLEDVHAIADLERVRKLFDELESKEGLLRLMETTQQAEGVRIFIGAENQLFTLSGCSLIVAPYRDTRRQIVGAIGVIGPTRLNYARIIPMVDYTAQVVGRLIG
ncbi:MAG: heat-inducible transcriptional repressor HrcA [Alphaproteobacteria bacterium]|nr:heat-inducible transcriptional repressor HrcA [Alphaproteobacteria bacterium]